MATKFQIKRSSVSGRTPNTTNAANSSYIAAGELALNLTDKKMYSSNGTNYFEIGSFKVEQTNSTSNVSTFTEISTLQFDEDSGFAVTSPSTGVAKIAINSTFKFWQVDGVQKLTATGLDTVNFIGGNNISITANGANTPQSIAFATSMTPTFTSVTFGNSTVNTTINSSAIAVTKIFANGVIGTAGKVLTSNGTGGVYWGDASSGGGGGDLTIISDTFNGNGSNTIFTLSVSTSTDKTFVYLNGVLQAPTTDYSVTGTTLTFVTAPPSDNVIEVRSFDIPSVADLTVTSDNFTGNGSNTQFTLTTSQSSNETSLVFLNGVAQVPAADYSISGSTLTFTAAPAAATNIQVTSYTAEDIVTTTYTGNGSNTQFTLGTTSTTTKTVVSLNGVTQTPTADYSVSGATLVFSVAPANNDKIIARAIPSTASSTAGSNTNIQYNKSGSLGGSAGFTFNETTNNVTIANTLTVPNFILNASNPPASPTATGTTGTFAWDSSYFYIATGTNTWKKTPITTDGAGGGSGTPGGSNTHIQYNDSNTFNGSAAFTFNESTNTVALSNTLAIGSNVTVNTSTIFIGNSSVNTTITAGNVHLQGTQLTVGNVVVNGNQLVLGNVTITDTQITVGNSTSNIVLGQTGSLSGNGAQLTSVNAIALQGNSVNDILVAANTAANTLASAAFSNAASRADAAFTNAASRADSAYSNAVAYAASNTYVNNTFLPLAGGTLTGALTINATANVVSNLSANNVTFRGNVQIDGNLVVSGTSVTLNVATLAVEDNMIHLNNGSTDTHPDLGVAGNYNDGTYKHAGIFRDATDGVWKVFDGYTPEPNTAFIDTSNASFRIAHFTANVITANGFTGNGASITSVDAATVGGNTASTLRTYSDTVAATAFSNAAIRADAAYSNAIAYSGNAALAFANAAARADAAFSNATAFAANAGNISSGTLNTARLPATVNVSTVVNVGANLNINTSSVQIGNSTANIVFSQSTVTINGVSHSFESIVNTATGANSVMIRNSAGDSAVGSRFHFTSAVADGGTFGIIGLNWGGAANTFKNFEVYDYVNGRPVFRSYGETRNFEIFGTANAAALILTTNTATIGTAAYVVANGNVGIGTATPGSSLHIVSGSADSTGFNLETTGSGGKTFFAVHKLGFIRIRSSDTNGAAMHMFDNAGSKRAEFSIGSDSKLNWYSDALTSNWLTFDGGNGRVGIGTTSPAERLHVSGTIQIDGTTNGIRIFKNGSNSITSHLYIANAANDRAYNWQLNSDGSTLDFWAYNGSSWNNRITYTASGNVGIGTTSPANKLHVDGAIRTSSVAGRVAYFRAASTNSDNIIQFEESDGSQIWEIVGRGYGAGQPFYIYKTGGTGSGFKYIIDSSGNHTFNGNMTVSGTITESSSVTLKENISPITNALHSIAKLVGVTYDRKDGSAKNRAGLIKEEVEKVIPNIVNDDGIQYTNLIAYLVESIKELKAEIDAIKSK